MTPNRLEATPPSASLAQIAIRARWSVPSWSGPSNVDTFLIVAVAALVLPTILALAQDSWSTSDGAHGPLIAISGVWLVFRERRHLRFRSSAAAPGWLLALPPLCLLYVYGRTLSMLGTETAALYLLLIVLGLVYFGAATLRRLWFPILYLAFLIKPPDGVVAATTQPLQIGLSQACTTILSALGYPVGHSGVLIQIAQYELLVKQACAGLGSIVTLFAMGLLYVHLSRSSGRARNLLLLAAIVPIALTANLARVILLVLLTYHVGDATAQGFLHQAAGLFTFAVSMSGMLALDRLLVRRPS